MPKWFDTGLFMEDNVTPIFVFAKSETEEKRYLENGWKPIAPFDEAAKKQVKKKRERPRWKKERPLRGS